MTAPRYRRLDGSNNAGRDTGKRARPLLDLGMDSVPFDPRRQPNPRAVSNQVFRQRHRVTRLDAYGRSEFIWAWGQFLDHELDLIGTGTSKAPIAVPHDDPAVEFRGTEIDFTRSRAELRNEHTSYVDASNVYGVEEERLAVLRDGPYLRTAPGPDGALLPKNTVELAGGRLPRNAPGVPADQAGRFFLAGDLRANEHCVLISLHTLFVREHNRLVEEIRRHENTLSDDDLFEEARKFVGAIMQAITYNEFLPALLGPDAIPPYTGFKPAVDPGISNLFATACYRIGHSMVRNNVQVVTAGRRIPLRDVFFTPELVDRLGIRQFLQPLAARRMAAIGASIVEDLRSNLFRRGGVHLLDLAALNIQRGRDHGLPDYNACRKALGLNQVPDMDNLTGDASLAVRMRRVYGDSMDGVDAWVGALGERPLPTSGVGELMHAALVDQFTRTRDGDHYWYEHDPAFSNAERAEIGATQLSDVLRRNIEGVDVPDDVFRV